MFENHPALESGRPVWMVEDELFFTQYSFHIRKLVYHKVTMAAFAGKLLKKGFKVSTIGHDQPEAKTEALFRKLSEMKIKEIHFCDTTDYLLERRLKRYGELHGIRLVRYSNPGFLCTSDQLADYFKSKKRFFLTDFYIAERKRQGILLDVTGAPVGDKWTFDTENRKKMPASVKIPTLPDRTETADYRLAVKSVRAAFPHAPGSADGDIYPTDHSSASSWLDVFLEKRFSKYGDYQDAIVRDQTFLFHSVITPMMNTGLLLPDQVMSRAIEAAEEFEVPMNALEGFVRQVMGWREFIRAVYELKGVEQRTRNYWNHSRRLPASFYDGTTGIAPVDDAIRKTLQTGYSHHIERLMVLGNFMVLCEFDPDDVYRWFMEMFIDAYDWVMVPNVYGMSQFADGGIMSTKPYISGSNYVLKMSDYRKAEWCETWDALFWRFIVA
ncbi:MAG: cryptochrome/photolyase family protein, partial [Bacteroidota bacterium]